MDFDGVDRATGSVDDTATGSAGGTAMGYVGGCGLWIWTDFDVGIHIDRRLWGDSVLEIASGGVDLGPSSRILALVALRLFSLRLMHAQFRTRGFRNSPGSRHGHFSLEI